MRKSYGNIKIWTNLKQIVDKHNKQIVVYEQVKNVEKFLSTAKLIYTKKNTFIESYDKFNDRMTLKQWALLRFLKFMTKVVRIYM